MKKALIISIVTSFLLTSCKKEKNDNNLLFLLLLGLQQNSSVAFTGKFGGVSASLGKNSKALPDGITDVLAISSNNNYHKAKVDPSGKFSLNINRGYNYIFVFIDSNNKVKGTYRLDNFSLNTLPTHFASSLINGGTVEKNSNDTYTPVSDFNINEFLSQTGKLEQTEIGVVASATKQILALSNIDTDENGIIDLEEGLITRINFIQKWENNSGNLPITGVNNQYLKLDVLKQSSPSTSIYFSIGQSKTKSSSIEFSYPLPSNCTDTLTNKRTNFFQDVGILPNGTVNTSSAEKVRSFFISVGSNCPNNSSLNNITGKGTYKFIDNSKTYTFNNIEAFKIESNETILFPSFKFNVSNDMINSVDYKFQKVSPNIVEDATDKEVNIVYGNSVWGSGLICSNNQTQDIWCYIPYTKASGTIENCNFGGNISNKASFENIKFSSLRSCNLYVIDSFGNNISAILN